MACWAALMRTVCAHAHAVLTTPCHTREQYHAPTPVDSLYLFIMSGNWEARVCLRLASSSTQSPTSDAVFRRRSQFENKDAMSRAQQNISRHENAAGRPKTFAGAGSGPSQGTSSAAARRQAAGKYFSTMILGRRTAPFPPFLIPHRAPHGVNPRS